MGVVSNKGGHMNIWIKIGPKDNLELGIPIKSSADYISGLVEMDLSMAFKSENVVAHTYGLK